MRLSKQEQATIHRIIEREVPAQAAPSIRVFGSCLDDTARGGDIDLYLEVRDMDTESRSALARRLRPRLEEALDRPADLVVQDAGAALKPIAAIARRDGILL